MARDLFRRAALVGAVVAGVGLAGAGTASAATPVDDLYDGLDDVADGLVCDGPLGDLLNQLVNCDPEDEPPFTSVPQE